MEHRSPEGTVAMTPDMAGFSDRVHEGALPGLLDRATRSPASCHSGGCASVFAVEQVPCKKANDARERVAFGAAVDHAGRTSMELGSRVAAEHIRAGAVRRTGSSHFTMGTVDDGVRRAELPTRPVFNEGEARRHGATELRRKRRREITAGPDRAVEGIE